MVTEEVVVPSCINPLGYNTSLQVPASLSASLGQSGSAYVLYATQPTGSVLVMRWSNETSFDAEWSGWTCFDSVRQPLRTSAANLSDFTPEVYATSRAGALFVRRYYLTFGWALWEPHPLPSAQFRADDVASVGLPSPILFLYVVGEGRVFVRHRESSNPLSPYQPWVELEAPPIPRRISAAIRPDGKQQVFVVSDTGAAFTAIQTDASPDAGFGAFERFSDDSTRNFAEIRCGYSAEGALAIFGLSSGAVWARSSFGDVWSAWFPESGDQAPTLATLAVGSSFGDPPTVFGTDSVEPSNATARPHLWHHLAGSGIWSKIPE